MPRNPFNPDAYWLQHYAPCLATKRPRMKPAAAGGYLNAGHVHYMLHPDEHAFGSHFYNTLMAHTEELTADEIEHLKADYKDWRQSCNSAKLETLLTYIEFVAGTLKNAGNNSHYLAIRLHFLQYATDTLRRKWPAGQTDDDIPF